MHDFSVFGLSYSCINILIRRKGFSPYSTHLIACQIMKGLSQSAVLIPVTICAAMSLLLMGITFWIFNAIYYIQPTPYLDEIFHIPQAINYCLGQFYKWDPKITTLPGLYLLSVGVLMPIDYVLGAASSLCNVYNLRLTNLVACAVNFYLIFDIRRKIRRVQGLADLDTWLFAMSAWSFPVLYFFTFLYYTDAVATGLVLLAYDLHLRGQRQAAAAVGLVAVAVRQTNVAWVVFLALDALPDVVVRQGHLRRGKHLASVTEKKLMYLKVLYKCLEDICQGSIWRIRAFALDCISTVGGYIVVGKLFALFLVLNHGIVVGDKTSHEPTLHLMQLCYFSAFLVAVCAPFFVYEVQPCVHFVQRNKIVTSIILLALLVLIHFNTLAHPYLLADNRHYVFYIWKRIYQRPIVPYLLAPLYFFGGFGIARLLQHTKITFRISYLACVILVLVPQKLLEFRYFIIPYLMFHLHTNVTRRWQLIAEFGLYTFVNAFTIYVFMTKTFYWTDSEEKQRIMW